MAGAAPRTPTVTARAPCWAEALFHVLAHVPAGALPSSLHAPSYVRFAADALGPPSARSLGEDVLALSAIARDHARYASLQALAWLWDGLPRALACAERDLDALSPAEVDAPELLDRLRSDPATELLRCAVLLESQWFLRLPRADCDRDALLAALAMLVPYAPRLAYARVSVLRPLTHHGRVYRDAIWVGLPSADVSLAHVAMQAAHEATVRELADAAPSLGEREREAVALVLLHCRVHNSAQASAHRAWCEHWRITPPALDLASLTPRGLAALETLEPMSKPPVA